MADLDNETYERACSFVPELTLDLMKYVSNEVKQKVPADIIQSDSENNYFFTIYLMGSFIKSMTYSLEIYALMNGKIYNAEEAVETIRQVALEMMVTKQDDFKKITGEYIKLMGKDNVTKQ